MQRLSSASLFTALVFSLAASAGCTERIIKRTEPAPPPGAGTDLPTRTDGEPEPSDAPWTETAPAPGQVNALSCPTSDAVYAATSKGLYLLDAEKWTKIADGAFSGVSIRDSANGFAAGDGVLAQLDASGWSAPEVPANWNIHAVYTDDEGAWLAGDGFMIPTDNLPREPKVLFVNASDRTMPPERAYGSRLTAGSIDFVTGNGVGTVVIGGSDTSLQRWNGGQWASVGSEYPTYGVTSAVILGSGLYATDGFEITEPGGSAWSPRGAGYTYPELRLLVAYKSHIVGVGDDGFVLHRPSRTSDYDELEDLEDDVALAAACITSEGKLFVGGGTRVFGRNARL